MNRTPVSPQVTSRQVSTSFIEISEEQARAQPLASAWQSADIPRQQLELVRGELDRWFDGAPFPAYDALVSVMKRIRTLSLNPEYAPKVLELGCGVGHYAAVLHRAGIYDYTGVDYNAEAVRLATLEWNHIALSTRFIHTDALTLPCESHSFDIVISAALLLHVFRWGDALREAARVATNTLVLHRTPIARRRTRYFVKHAYGVPCLEIHFSEHELFEQIYACGFELKHVELISEGVECSYKTYLLERPLTHHPV